MRILFICIAILLALSSSGQKRMCVTVDDMPTVTYGMNQPEDQRAIISGLIEALKYHEVPAIGYVNESKLYRKNTLLDLPVDLLEEWMQAGFELGNHTYRHVDFHRVSFETYVDDILAGERITRPLMNKYGKELRYFRHPYLRRGLRQGQADSLTQFLQVAGYVAAPVTIDNEEYIFAKAYAVALRSGRQGLADSVGTAYLAYMADQLTYFEGATGEVFGRPIVQTLLIHANLLNARYLDRLLRLYTSRGYQFVSQSQALGDPAYLTPISRHGDWGISWVQLWGMSQGLKDDFFKGEAVTPEFVYELGR